MQGKLLLSVAADAGKMDEVNRLLSQGVDVNARGSICGRHGFEVIAMLATFADGRHIFYTCNLQPFMQWLGSSLRQA